MSESENLRIEIDDNIPINNNDQVANEWYSCHIGNKVTKRYDLQRHIEKVPLLLLKGLVSSRLKFMLVSVLAWDECGAKRSNKSSNEGIKFLSHCCYGELKLVPRAVSLNTKAIYMNMIAYEMCAHNANDLRVSTYIRVMKSLVIQRDDAKELRKRNILVHCLGRDEDVVKMFDEIHAPLVNPNMFYQLRLEIEKHCKGSMLRRLGYMCKSWWAELITVYFSSPWKTVALLAAEKYKLITLEEFSLSCDKSMCVLYNKVFEVVEDARNCYIDGSTDSYNDEEFTQMMLRDACFVLLFIQGILFENNKLFMNNEYLGPLGCANIVRDIFLLENQIPFVVLAVLLELRYPTDKGEDALNRFFHYLNYGEVTYGEVMIRNEKVIKNRQPLHLLELYRSCFISLKVYNDFGPTSSSSRGMLTNDSKLDWNYVKRNQPLKSVTELKARGIFLKRMSDESSNEGIKFHSHCCYGELELVHRTVYWNTKAIYLNMIAYEMCAHNANDLRVSTYIRVMKSLVLQPEDVKELRNQNILLHCLASDEEVVKLFDEIYAPLSKHEFQPQHFPLGDS
ncbi:hypothetical protein M8C21_009058 [Ambrosia artemisiifolia]|uniref:Uncharacterized protein n=1 Tax=Ambrosia artemisiifolia TaxID=4212 RepID=A0AAD5GW09_AMBAR|nr:hypothetical protein M8C21_009058 [Ambrosia artemisiifolia]